MNYEERKIEILKALVSYDNLGRILNTINAKNYAEIREALSYEDFFWLVRELHQQYLIDAIFSDIELESKPEDPQIGTLKIRQEGIDYLINYKK
jgi:hypothetical protein